MTSELTILGTGAAIPAFGRHLTAQVFRQGSFVCLIDCGEGTQMQMMRYGIKMHKIDHVFISHLHGDHFFGLAGFLMTLDLQGRKKTMHIFGPAELKNIIKAQLINSLSYELIFYTVEANHYHLIYENSIIQVFALPMQHRIACTGFLFEEKQALPNILKAQIQAYDIPYQFIDAIKKGAGFRAQNGQYIPHESLVLPASKPLRYAFCSDTAYQEALLPYLQGVDLLYHEATFMHEKLHLATKTGHSTALQAARLAKLAKVKKLLIGHFSARYQDVRPLLAEARAHFKASFLAEEGAVLAL